MQRDAIERISDARTFLFVPATRPERFGRALTSGADVVIVDLEDAVAPEDKVGARAALIQKLDPAHPVLVRINDAGTPWFDGDLAIAGRPGVLGFMLSKAEPGSGLDRTVAACPVVALIESASGMAAVQTIAATEGVCRLAFGTIDLALDLGIGDEDLLSSFGLQLVLASRAARLPSPIHGVTPEFRDPKVVQAAMIAAARSGFGAKMCIHPAQITPTLAALMPTEEELAWAKRVKAAADVGHRAAVALDGKMVDRPVIERALRILHNASGVPRGAS